MNPFCDDHRECISIVVPVYNRPALLVRCLESLKAQSYRPLHVIVVDNASTDETLAVVDKWKLKNSDDNFSIDVLTEPRPGAAYARQTGFEHVLTDKVMFFDSDDVMKSECVSEVVRAWENQPDAEMVAWPVTVHGPSGPVTTHSIKGDLIDRHLVHAIFRTQGYAVKTAYLKACGGWRGEFPVWNDFETGTRLILNDPKVISIKDSLVDVFPQAESITGLSFSNKHGKWEKSLDGIDDIIDKSGRKDRVRLHNIITYRRAILAAHYAKEGHAEYARPLYEQALKEIPKEKRPLIRFAYHWTRLRMRGAFSIIGRFM